MDRHPGRAAARGRDRRAAWARHRPNPRPSAATTWRHSCAASRAGRHGWDQRQNWSVTARTLPGPQRIETKARVGGRCQVRVASRELARRAAASSACSLQRVGWSSADGCASHWTSSCTTRSAQAHLSSSSRLSWAGGGDTDRSYIRRSRGKTIEYSEPCGVLTSSEPIDLRVREHHRSDHIGTPIR